jgi:hypothetical protein
MTCGRAFSTYLRELSVDATLAISMIVLMVLIAVFMVLVEQDADQRRDREFEQELAAWRARLYGRDKKIGERVSN